MKTTIPGRLLGLLFTLPACCFFLYLMGNEVNKSYWLSQDGIIEETRVISTHSRTSSGKTRSTTHYALLQTATLGQVEIITSGPKTRGDALRLIYSPHCQYGIELPAPMKREEAFSYSLYSWIMLLYGIVTLVLGYSALETIFAILRMLSTTRKIPDNPSSPHDPLPPYRPMTS